METVQVESIRTNVDDNTTVLKTIGVVVLIVLLAEATVAPTSESLEGQGQGQDQDQSFRIICWAGRGWNSYRENDTSMIRSIRSRY